MVMAASAVVTQLSSVPDGLVSLAVGLIGVWLARWVFVSRENRLTKTPQKWNDTLPLTLVAMLVAGVIIHDRKLALSAAAFTGLGTGWVAVVLLDVFGERIASMLRAGFAVPESKLPPIPPPQGFDPQKGPPNFRDTNVPTDMTDQLDQLPKDKGQPHD